MALQIRSAKNIQRTEPVRVLLYGASKVGKTHLCGRLPKPFIIAPRVEGGIRTLQGLDVPYVEVSTPQDLEDTYRYLISDKARKLYQTVVVDSLTFIQNNVYMPAILEARGTMFPDQRDWGQLLENMRRLTRQMADLPYDVWFVCLEAEKEDLLTQTILIRPLLTGQFSSEAPAYCHVVMRLVADTKRRKVGEEPETTRYLLLAPGLPGFGNYLAGDRDNQDLPPFIKDPTADKVVAALKGSTRKKEVSRGTSKSKASTSH